MKLLILFVTLVTGASFKAYFNKLKCNPARNTLQMNKYDDQNKDSEILPNFIRKFIPVLLSAGLAFSSPVFATDDISASWSPGLTYSEVAVGNGATPKPGDIVAIRFKGSYKGVVFDDTFSTAEPYLYRCGVGSVVKGLDEAVVHMKVGDRWKLSFGGELGFGEKGKPSSPGKPRIPPMATIDYEVELVALPGMDDDFILDVEDEST